MAGEGSSAGIVAGGEQGAHLVEQAVLEQPVRALVDPTVEDQGRSTDADDPHRTLPLTRCWRTGRPRRRGTLERARHPTWIVQVGPCGSRRVGGSQELKVDVRLISATNRDPHDAIKHKKLREDLYYRLNVFPLALPTLAERREDISLLAEHFRKMIEEQERAGVAGWDPKALEMLLAYNWPGNVRELENSVERAIALNSSGVLTPEDFPLEIRQCHSEDTLANPLAPHLTLAEKEKEYILEILQATNQNASRAADILDIDRRTLYRILERHGIQRG